MSGGLSFADYDEQGKFRWIAPCDEGFRNACGCSGANLYVVRDKRLDLTKIGLTKLKLSQRLSIYNSNGCDWFEMLYSRAVACEQYAKTQERMALDRLAEREQRVRGDWFDIRDPSVAVAAVDFAVAKASLASST